MRNRPFPEAVLALATGRQRAGAIYGDLIELAATRGDAWFWLAYARTLVALTWRTVVAFVAGFMAFDLLASSLQMLDRLTNGATHASFDFGFAFIAFPLAVSALVLASMILAFCAATLYGLRDRMALLACAILLTDLYAFAFASSNLTLLIPSAVLGGAFCFSRLRRVAAMYVMTLLIATTAVAALVMPIASKATFVEEHLLLAASTAITMIACTRLRRRIMGNEWSDRAAA